MIIRVAVAADIPALHRLRCSVVENRLSDPNLVTEASYCHFIGSNTLWVAEERENLLGFVAIDPPAASVWALFVAPISEGRGVGRALLSFAVDRARELGLHRLSLSTGRGTRAERFYRNAGWQATESKSNGEQHFELSL